MFITILLTIVIAVGIGAAAGAGICWLAVNVLTSLHADMSIMMPLVIWGAFIGLICGIFRIGLLKRRASQFSSALLGSQDQEAAAIANYLTSVIGEGKKLISGNGRQAADSLFPAKILNGSSGLTPTGAHAERIHELLADNACEHSRLEMLCAEVIDYEKGGADK